MQESHLPQPVTDKEMNFESLRSQDKNGQAYWSARELQVALGYSSWQRFETLINKAKVSFNKSETHYYNINDHFNQVVKMIPTGKGAERAVDDYLLSRYACYLIAQNGDPSK